VGSSEALEARPPPRTLLFSIGVAASKFDKKRSVKLYVDSGFWKILS
jgi:hypothetical protein